VNKEHFSLDIEVLRARLSELEKNTTDPAQLRKAVLETCSDLMSLLKKLQSIGLNTSTDQPSAASERADSTTEATKALESSQREIMLAEIVAEHRTRQLSALHTATAALLSTLDLESLLGQILDAANVAIPAAEKGMLHLIAPDTGELEMRASIGYTDNRIRKFSVPGSKGYIATAVRERCPILIDDFDKDPSLRHEGKIPETRPIRSAIVAPLILKDEVLGALSLDSASPSAFTDMDLQLLTSFAVTATEAIRNAQLHAEVQKQAITDSLTGLYNRRGFTELGRREVERALRFRHPLSAIMIDIDLFKIVNDTYGHNIGDLVLRAIATRCNSNVRTVDILGRFGGDEFILLLPETDMFTAAGVAERLRLRAADTPVVIENYKIPITISLGVAKLAGEPCDLDSLLNRADAAMYTAKQSGRNQVEVG